MLHIRDFLSHIHRIYDQEYYEQNKMVYKRLSENDSLDSKIESEERRKRRSI